MAVQVGNPSFLYEEMLDYEESNPNPDVDDGSEKVSWWTDVACSAGVSLNLLGGFRMDSGRESGDRRVQIAPSPSFSFL